MEENLNTLFSLVCNRRKATRPIILLLGVRCSYFPETLLPGSPEVLRSQAEPSEIENGYKFLAKLMKENYFDIVITTDYGNLLENALYEEGVRPNDFIVSISGINSFNQMTKKIDRLVPNMKIIKIRGQVPSEIIDCFAEIVNERDIIIIGHSLKDPFLGKIIEQSHARIWYVEANLSTDDIADLSDQTKSRTVVITNSIGRFPRFLSKLYIFTRQQQASTILRNSSEVLNEIIERIKVDCLKRGDFLLSVGRKSHSWIDIYELRDYKQLMSKVLKSYLEVSLAKQRRYTIVTVFHPEDSEKFFPTADVAEAAVSSIKNPYLTHSRAIHNKFTGETTFKPNLQGECILLNVISTHLSTVLDLVNTIRTREKKEISTVITFIEREEISRRVLKSRNINMCSFILYDEFSNSFTISDELLTGDLDESLGRSNTE